MRLILTIAPLVALPMLPIFSAESNIPVETGASAHVEGTLSISARDAAVSGDKSAFQKIFRSSSGFGGELDDMNFRRETGSGSLLVNGRASTVDHDYRISVRWIRDDLGFVDFGYGQFRSFYDGTGGFFAPSQSFFSLYDEALHSDRGRAWLEIGLTLENRPEIRLRYERLTVKGRKPTTQWGDTNLTGNRGARSIVPAFIDMDEIRHILVADITRNTDAYRWKAGARYEHSDLAHNRQTLRRPAEATATRNVATRENTENDLFSVHAFAEKTFGEKLRTSAGAMMTTLDVALGGDRVYGDGYEPIYSPAFPRHQTGDLGFLNLDGGTQLKQYVFNLNSIYLPARHWSFRPGLRYEHMEFDNLATFISTNVQNNLSTTLINNLAQTQKQENRLTEVAELRYTGFPNWTYSLKGEWHQAKGDLMELQTNALTAAALIDRATDYSRKIQKYALGTHWYARPRLTFSAEYYYRLQLNDYRSTRDTTLAGSNDRYPAFVIDHDFVVHDFNLRMSWRPASMISLVTRYDLQHTTVTSSFSGVPEIRSGRTMAHVVSQSVTWMPLARLYIIGSGNLVFDQLSTPAAYFVSNSDNNYVNASLSAGYALSPQTDLRADLNHYQARNFTDSSGTTMPYGAGQKTDSIALTCTIKESERLIYSLKYVYAIHDDETSGGINDFHAHLVYAKAQYRF